MFNYSEIALSHWRFQRSYQYVYSFLVTGIIMMEDARMGLIAELKCPKCGYRIMATEWINGFADKKYYNEKYLQSVLDNNNWLKNLYSMMDHPEVHYEHRLCFCEKCRTLTDEMKVYIKSDQGNFSSSVYCSKCGNIMMEYPCEKWDSVPCPECSKKDNRLVLLDKTDIGIAD